jgi:DNA-binding response OmpR family regulator
LRKAQDLRPEVVICDIGLPEMDGYEVATRMRADPRTASARLFALTGYGDENAAKRAEEAGFDFHLTKPVDVALLRQLLAAGAQTAHPATGLTPSHPDCGESGRLVCVQSVVERLEADAEDFGCALLVAGRALECARARAGARHPKSTCRLRFRDRIRQSSECRRRSAGTRAR